MSRVSMSTDISIILGIAMSIWGVPSFAQFSDDDCKFADDCPCPDTAECPKPVGSMAVNALACLITKTDTNPFFVRMKEGASAAAEDAGMELATFAGKYDGDIETQVAAVDPDSKLGFKTVWSNGLKVTFQ